MGTISFMIEGKRRWFLLTGIILVVFVVVAGVFLFTTVMGRGVKQPIQFNHKSHKEQGVECITCHQYVQEQAFAGFPKIEVCLGCHEQSITESREEEKIRVFQKEGTPVRWRSLYNQPDHVFFSHRRHVKLGQIECGVCHGDFDERTIPPSKPLVNLSMDRCMECHEGRGADNDCMVCHI
ncbi:MAG: hypothetical protein GTO13_13780 [Proteobacteria bacterium]|nr:hypothetical protein [Pseudomonadota bacterium]